MLSSCDGWVVATLKQALVDHSSNYLVSINRRVSFATSGPSDDMVPLSPLRQKQSGLLEMGCLGL